MKRISFNMIVVPVEQYCSSGMLASSGEGDGGIFIVTVQFVGNRHDQFELVHVMTLSLAW